MTEKKSKGGIGNTFGTVEILDCEPFDLDEINREIYGQNNINYRPDGTRRSIEYSICRSIYESDDGLSCRELVEIVGCASSTINQKMRRLIADGTVAVEQGIRKDIIGRPQRVPIYRLKPDGEYARLFDEQERRANE